MSHDIDAAFNDRDYGPWTGHAKADVIAQWGSVDAAPGVESSATVLARAMAALDALIRSSDRPIAVVTHDAVIRPILARIHPDLAPDVETGSVGYAGFDSTALAAEANRMTYTRRWLAETKPVWEPVACPTCAGTSTGRLCRTHLLEAGIDAASAADTSSYLAGLDRRLRLLVDSMTQNGTPSTPDADASWVEAVAWFAGWSFPLALSSDDSNRINP